MAKKRIKLRQGIDNLPKTLAKAREIGSTFYDNGKPCKRNSEHSSIRRTNSRSCRDCGRENAKQPSSIQRAKDWYNDKSHPEKMLSWAKYRHKAYSYLGDFDLTIDNVVFPEYCPILGIKLKYETQRDRQAEDAPTVDRIDSTKGYTSDNVQIISRKANRIKNDGTPEEIMKVGLYMLGLTS